MSANLQSTSNALKDANPATNKEAEPTPNPQAEKPADPITNQGNQTQAAAKQPTAPKPKPPKKQTKASGTTEDPTQDSPGKPAKETQEADREKGLQMVLGTKHNVDNPNANVTNNKMSRVERLQEEAMAEMWETAQAAKKAGDHDKAKLYHGYYASMVTNPKDPAPTEDTTHNTPTINTLTFKRKEQDLTTIRGTRSPTSDHQSEAERSSHFPQTNKSPHSLYPKPPSKMIQPLDLGKIREFLNYGSYPKIPNSDDIHF
ncbi:hypothetical protein PtB15_8B72 [Puccinia triticina]|nr:hypothetical protein PtB15_8B72 [Puccinia triticina]